MPENPLRKPTRTGDVFRWIFLGAVLVFGPIAVIAYVIWLLAF